MSKNSKINFACRSGHSMSSHKFLTKKNILCGIGEKDKNISYKVICSYTNLSFYRGHKKCSFLSENLCMNITYPDVHAKKICSKFFDISKYVF
jgi:hypothetical protein